MTLASSIITDAYRESNIIPLVGTPNTNQVAEGLARLNVIVASVLGHEVGDPLNDLNISGGQYDQTAWCNPYIPYDARLVLKLTAPQSFSLDPNPTEGQRLSFVDVGNNLATYAVTLDGNGRTIEGSATLTLNTNGDSRQWLYRADTGNWVKLTTLADTDQMPYPTEFDDFFVTSLAMRLNPRYGQSLAQETVEVLKESKARLRARYNHPKPIGPDLDTNAFLTNYPNIFGLSNYSFNIGRPYPWR